MWKLGNKEFVLATSIQSFRKLRASKKRKNGLLLTLLLLIEYVPLRKPFVCVKSSLRIAFKYNWIKQFSYTGNIKSYLRNKLQKQIIHDHQGKSRMFDFFPIYIREPVNQKSTFAIKIQQGDANLSKMDGRKVERFAYIELILERFWSKHYKDYKYYF